MCLPARGGNIVREGWGRVVQGLGGREGGRGEVCLDAWQDLAGILGQCVCVVCVCVCVCGVCMWCIQKEVQKHKGHTYIMEYMSNKCVYMWT